MTDIGNAERLVKRHGSSIRYIDRLGGWHVYDGTRYCFDELGQIVQLAKDTIRAIHIDIASVQDDKQRKELIAHALRSEKRKALVDMIELAKSEHPVAARAAEMDTDPWMLNLRNGVLDLRTGELGRHDPALNLTKLAAARFDPEAKCETWIRFLDEIFQGDQDLIAYAQRLLGYCLTGDTREQCVFLFEGCGSNGKSTLLETVRAILGDYAQSLPFEALLVRERADNRIELARAIGARFVTAVEPPRGKAFDESVLKQLTGGDTISARKLYKDYFDYRPQFKICMAVNQLPPVRAQDHGTWRRFHTVHFGRKFEDHEKDTTLPRRLLEERDGIAYWMFQGCLAWLQQGLNPPECVSAATAAYKSTMDPLGAFLSEKCAFKPQASVTVKELWQAYCTFTKDQGEDPIRKNDFLPLLRDRGVTDGKGAKGVRVYRGIRLNDGQQGLEEPEEERGGEGGGDSHNFSHSRMREEDLRKNETVLPPQVQNGVAEAIATEEDEYDPFAD